MGLVGRKTRVAHRDAFLLQCRASFMQSDFGCVVVVAQMVEKHEFQFRCPNVGNKLCRHFIVEVPAASLHACLQIGGIFAGEQHVAVVVALNHQVLGLAHVEICARGDFALVGRHHKPMSTAFHHKTATVFAIVRLLECGDGHTCHRERNFVENGFVVFFNAIRNAMLAEHANEASIGAPHTNARRFIFAQ